MLPKYVRPAGPYARVRLIDALSLCVCVSTSAALGLQTYFTAGEKEVKAWTIRQGMTAPQAAGVIHTYESRKRWMIKSTARCDTTLLYSTLLCVCAFQGL